MKIQELAKKYDVAADELITLLKNAGYDVENRASAVDYDMLAALERHFSWDAPKSKKKTKSKSRRKAAATAEPVESKTKAKIKAKSKIVRKARPEPEPEPEPEVASEPKAAAKTKAKAGVKAKAKAKAATKAKAKVTAKTKAKAKAAPAPETKAAPTAPKSEATKKAREKETPARAATVLEEAPAPPKPAPKPGKPAKPGKPGKQPVGEPERGERPRRGKPGRTRRTAQEAQQRAVRESVRRTLAKLETTRKTKRRKTRGNETEAAEVKPVQIQERSTAAQLAASLGIPLEDVLACCEDLGVPAVAGTELDRETLEVVAEELERAVEIEAVYGETRLKEEAQVDPAKLEPRAPVVTVMGHVDHGKTSILDYIRHTNVAGGEAGGITQHIGAYEVEMPTGKITFIDTPGHEAFTAMRARGAMLTDIVVLVVAADDGVMPQTIEAINHTRAAGVPMVVAVNKVDLAGANPANVKQQLTQHGVVVEEFGGEVVSVDVSARTGQGIDRLLEMILLQAEILELKADPTTRAQGVVVEVKKEEGRGILTTILVQQGTLHVGDVLVMGNEYGKVRSLIDHVGKRIKEAGPSMPALVLGANGVPEAGDSFIAVKNEREAREVSGKRKEATRARELQPAKALTLEDLYAQIQGGEVKELNLIVKADTNGSVEALHDSLERLEVAEIKVKVIHVAVGVVSESDVLLAQSSNAVVIAFNVGVSPKAKQVAKEKGIEIRSYEIIYEALEAVHDALEGMLEPEYVERVLGRAEVRKLFRSSKAGTVAGSMVVSGTIPRNAAARVLREGEAVFDGKIGSLKRFQDDVREVSENFECGIGVAGFNDFEEGDVIEAYVVEEKARVV